MTPDVSSAVPVQDTQALMDLEFAGSAGLGAAGAGAAGAGAAGAGAACAGTAGAGAAGAAGLVAAGAAGVTEAAAAALDTTAPTVLLAGDAPVTVLGLPAAADVADAGLSLELPPQAASASASVRGTVHGAPARTTSGQGFAPEVAARRVDETA
jgi:hypothetical protein